MKNRNNQFAAVVDAAPRSPHQPTAATPTHPRRRRSATVKKLAMQPIGVTSSLEDSTKDNRLLEDLLQQSNVVPQEAPQRDSHIFRVLGHDEILSMPNIEWLIEGVLAEGQSAMLVGAPSSGKTFIVLDLAMCAVSGRPWASLAVPRPLTVMYCAAEGISGFAARYEAAAQAHGVGEKDLKRFRLIDKVPQLYKIASEANPDTFVVDVKAQIAPNEKIDIVVIDTLHKASVGSEENSSSHAGEILANVDKIAKALDCSVILVHHTTKSGGNYRGSSALEGDVDNILHIEADGDRRWIGPRKLRDGSPWEPKSFELREHMGSAIVAWREEVREPAPTYIRPPTSEEQIVTLLASGSRRTREEIAKALGMPTSTVKSAVQSLIASGAVSQAKRGRASEFWLPQPEGRADEKILYQGADAVVDSSFDEDPNFEL